MQDPQHEVTQNSAGPVSEKEIGKDSDDNPRKEKQEEKENVHLEEILKRRFEKEDPETWEQEESAQKKPKTTNKDDVIVLKSSFFEARCH